MAEHFDLAAVHHGGDPDDAFRTANVGFSPGDAATPEPYLYVGPSQRDGLDDPFWNVSYGAQLGHADLAAADDPAAMAWRSSVAPWRCWPPLAEEVGGRAAAARPHLPCHSPPTLDQGPPMARVQANDITINAIKLGEGLSGPLPPVVFVHGLIMDNLSSYYYTVAPATSTETEVVLYDLRGHGVHRPACHRVHTRRRPRRPRGAPCHAPRAHPRGPRWQQRRGHHRAARRDHPARELVAGIGLIEAHPVVEGWGDHLMADIEELVAGFDEPGVREFITGEGGRKLKRMAGVCEDMVTKTSLPADLRAATVMDAELLGRIRCPALLLYGEASDILDRAELLAAEIPGAELRILDGCSTRCSWRPRRRSGSSCTSGSDRCP